MDASGRRWRVEQRWVQPALYDGVRRCVQVRGARRTWKSHVGDMYRQRRLGQTLCGEDVDSVDGGGGGWRAATVGARACTHALMRALVCFRMNSR